jgi:hypothetical protein
LAIGRHQPGQNLGSPQVYPDNNLAHSTAPSIEHRSGNSENIN